MTTQATTQRLEERSKKRSVVLLSLVLGAALSATVALAGTAARQAEAASSEKIVFASERTTGTGVNNPTGDNEIFKMNPDGTGLRQLTSNTANEYFPVLSPDGKKIAYTSVGKQTTNPEGDSEVYLMNALDGTAKRNLSNNGAGITDSFPGFSPGGQKIAYLSYGIQTTNPEGDDEIYLMSALDGSDKKNLSNNGSDVDDGLPVFSPGGQKIAYTSEGIQTSNPQGDREVYRMNALDGAGKKNLSNNAGTADDYYPTFSPGGLKIAYTSYGKQTSNPQGDSEVYRVNVLDGTGKKNLTDNGADDNYADWGVQGM